MTTSPPDSCKVYTDPELARAMVRALGDVPGGKWLEPAHGKGAFLHALASFGVSKERVTAIDLDSASCDADELAVTQRGVDFLQWSTQTNSRFDRIVGNPPYVAISRLPRILQDV